MISTLTNNNHCELIETYSSSYIIENYRETYNVEVSYLLEKIENIELYRCLRSDYFFFMPSSIAGDSNFYQQLEKHSWYYTPWKWEHQKATEYIKPMEKVLEVGAGQGDFLILMRKMMGVYGVGLELNSSAIKKGRKNGANLIDESIHSYSKNNSEKFDVVCMFQVLEHLVQVKEVIESCLKCLKPKGFLIVSVPNNDSFIKMDKNNVLNMPPHHMGRWKESSLRNLSDLFQIDLVGIHIEPLQEIHIDWYINTQINNWIKSKFLKKAIHYLTLKLLISRIIKSIRQRITGHTIMAVYQK